jgi:DNA-binding transcriptional regulator YiaG
MSGNVEKRFYRKLGPKLGNGCIEWQGWRNNRGYGMLKSSDKPYRHLLAHRLAYEFHYGRIPQGHDVMHKCDNPRCVNHEHLTSGTAKDNVQDMLGKDRQRKSRFNESDFQEIAEMRNKGLTQSEIALVYKVSRPLISMILSGKISPSTLTVP